MRENTIIGYTEQVAAHIAERHGGSPMAELRVWLRLAHQREAMVSELYELSALDRRLNELPESTDAHAVMRSVVLSIWAHESSHTRFLGSLRKASETFQSISELQGQIEGWIMQGATAGNRLAHMLIAIGASLGRAPEFTRDLGRMSLRELWDLHTELETTARMGYERMLQLSAELVGNAAAERELGYTFRYDLARILCEENFHEAAFREMAGWLDVEGRATDARPARERVKALHELCAQNLSLGALRRGVDAQALGFEAQLPPDGLAQQWVSDGGLEALFAQAGLAVPLWRPA